MNHRICKKILTCCIWLTIWVFAQEVSTETARLNALLGVKDAQIAGNLKLFGGDRGVQRDIFG